MKQEDYIAVADALNVKLEEHIKAAKESHSKNMNYLDRLYIDAEAKYNIGDIIRAEKINKFIKIEKRTVSRYLNNRVEIVYHGLSYKKVDNEFIRTKNKTVHRFSDKAILIKKGNDSVLST